jgi:hypothetical protein
MKREGGSRSIAIGVLACATALLAVLAEPRLAWAASDVEKGIDGLPRRSRSLPER